MRLARAAVDGVPTAGLIEGETFVPLAGGVTVDDVVRGAAAQRGDDGARVPLADVRLLAPLTRFNRDVLCTGWNYWDTSRSRGASARVRTREPDPSTRPSSRRAPTR